MLIGIQLIGQGSDVTKIGQTEIALSMLLAFTPNMSPRVFGLLIVMVIGSGCEVTRALRQPIPSSARDNTQDERAERIGEVIRDTMRAEGIPAISVARSESP